jgi:hypothetical protein
LRGIPSTCSTFSNFDNHNITGRNREWGVGNYHATCTTTATQ